MNLYINGRKAVIKADSSVELVAENRLLTDADSYSFAISLPMEFAENRDIFGFAEIPAMPPADLRLPAEIVLDPLCLSGCVAVTGGDDRHIEVQFLEGKSAANFEDPFDKIYINERNLGYGDVHLSAWPDVRRLYDHVYNGEVRDCVALPWENNTSGVPHNEAYVDGAGEVHLVRGDTAVDRYGISWMPYLLPLVKKIARAAGYAWDLTAWENSDLACLLVCNVLPPSWGLFDFARALPHWTINEFLDNIAVVLGGEFDVNHTVRNISFRFMSAVMADLAPVVVDRVVDEYTHDTDAEERSAGFRFYKQIQFEDRGDTDWNFESCRWFVESWPATRVQEVRSFEELRQIVAALPASRDDLQSGETLYHVVSESWPDSWYIVEKARYRTSTDKDWEYVYYNRLRRINAFAPFVPSTQADVREEERDTFSLKCVPVRISQDSGFVMLDVGSYDEYNGSDPEEPDDTKTEDEYFTQYRSIQMIKEGKPDTPEYLSKLYLGFWPQPKTGDLRDFGFAPIVDGTRVTSRATEWRPQCSLCLDSPTSPATVSPLSFEPRRKYSFSFLVDDISKLNARARWFIGGVEYVCLKYSVTVDPVEGPSQLVKGEFYRAL